MIVTEQGRIVKTINFPVHNLAHRNSAMQTWDSASTWQTYYDWQADNQYGYIANVSTTKLSRDKVTSELWRETLEHWQETVSYPELTTSIQNHYWVSKEGWVLKSIQHIGPQMGQIEMDILKPYVEAN